MARFSIPMMGFLLLCIILLAPTEAAYLKYKDPKQPLNVRIGDLMKRMTLEEKIGQMVQIERSVATPDAMTKYFIGNQPNHLQTTIFCLLHPFAFVQHTHITYWFISGCWVQQQVIVECIVNGFSGFSQEVYLVVVGVFQPQKLLLRHGSIWSMASKRDPFRPASGFR